MLLKDLLSDDLELLLGKNSNLDFDIKSVEIDSRLVKDGSIFFALKGKSFNGLDFIGDVIKKGAVAVVCGKGQNIPDNIDISDLLVIKADNVQDLLVLTLGKFYHNLPNNILAVTGTNGKTSVVEFCRQIFEFLGLKAASIGTLGVNVTDGELQKKLRNTGLTTPDIVSFYKNLSLLKENEIDNISIEASSIGLQQGRVDGIDFKAGAFTNFTQDHLDYHASMEEYFSAKMILFSKILQKKSQACLNADISCFSKIRDICNSKELEVISYGKKGEDFCLKEIKRENFGYQVSFEFNRKRYIFETNLLEEFQIYNILCALSLIISSLSLNEEELGFLMKKLRNLKHVCGRMEHVVTLNNNAKIYIDFAHTPDALENILKVVRNQAKGRVVILFGCGGDRDKTKRSKMGNIASNLADLIIVTDDNPRTEDSKKIREEIITGIENISKVIEVDDRKEAIKEAVMLLKKDDILIVAGKGHENYQIIGKDKIKFNEKDIILGSVEI